MLLRLVSGGGSLRVSGRASVLRGRTAATATSGGGATTTSMTMSTAASIYVRENNDHSAIMQQWSGIGDPTASRMTKLDNGVTVLSSYSESSSSSSATSGNAYVTTRISNSVGSRYDKVGGESALLATAMAGGGIVGREYISFPGVSSLSSSSLSSPSSSSSSISTAATTPDNKTKVSATIRTMTHETHMFDRLHETAYQTSYMGNSLGSPLYGTAESLGHVTKSDVDALLNTIHGGDVVVVATGNGSGASSHDKLVEDASKAYGNLPSSARASAAGSVVKAEDKSAFIGSDIRIRYDSMNVATIAIGFAGASHSDPKVYPLALMKAILGSYTASDGLGKNIASSMCQEVADHELASSISTFNLSYSDAGLFGIVATAPDNKLDDLLWYIMPSMVRLAHGISDEELLRAKLVLKSSILAMYDGHVAVGETMATQMATIGRVMSPAEALCRVDALDHADVKSVASEVINDQDHALAAIGGIHELPDYNWIRRHSYMLRY